MHCMDFIVSGDINFADHLNLPIFTFFTSTYYVEAEMQDVTGDPPDENDTLSEALGMDRFLDSPDMQPRKPRKQNCSRNKKSMFCMHMQ